MGYEEEFTAAVNTVHRDGSPVSFSFRTISIMNLQSLPLTPTASASSDKFIAIGKLIDFNFLWFIESIFGFWLVLLPLYRLKMIYD